jgi:hypothetical protein
MIDQMTQVKEYLLTKGFVENDTNLFVYREGVGDEPTPQALNHAREALKYLRGRYEEIAISVEVVDEWIDFTLSKRG